MKAETLPISGLLLISTERYADHRGFLSTSWSRQAFGAIADGADFVQENLSHSTRRGTVRGLHCQVAPRAQGKLIRVLRGAIWDVAVDIRAGSPSYGRHVGVELNAEVARQFWVPAGFLHGFCTLEDATEVGYKLTDEYAPATERGVAWNDPTLGIAWPVAAGAAILSDRDRALPPFAAARDWFPV